MPAPEPERPFDLPWQAALFALTHALARAGAFGWADWAAWFGRALADADAAGAPTDGSTYYDIWLSAFERFLVDRGLADSAAMAGLRDAWRDAYLTTPHGAPVELSPRAAVP